MTEPKRTIHAAFLEAYAEIQNPKKNAANPAFRSKYANLEEMLAVTKPVLVAVGLALVQSPVSDGDRVGIQTRIMDGEGASLDFGSFTVALSKPDPQGAGSALTYCRRYSIGAIFGLAQEDDDGNAASGHTPPSGGGSASKPASGGSGAHSAPHDPNDPGAYVLTFGKHKGANLAAVDVLDHGYVTWMAGQDGDKPAIIAAQAFLDKSACEVEASADEPSSDSADYADDPTIPF